MEKVNLTFYTAIGNPQRIPLTIRKLFAPVTKSFSDGEDKVVLTLQDDTQLIFNLSHVRDNAEFIEKHITGMANYFAQAETGKPMIKEKILQQIMCFNCVVGIVFQIDENSERTHYITNTLFDLAHELNGYLLYPNMHIYDGEGKLVFSIQGESELDEFSPIANADLLDAERPAESEADRQRRERSIMILKQQGIPYMEKLRTEATESEVHLKDSKEMLQRACCLFAIAVYSEVMLSEEPDRNEALTYFNKMDEIYGIRNWLTLDELAYLENSEPQENECIQFLWKYECCATLLWAAGVVEELPFPSEICDVPVIAGIFWQHQGMDDLLSKSIPRTPDEILDTADLTLRYDWACVDARVHEKETPAQLDGGVVMERHYTFNWIIGANHNADWDKIQPNT